MSHILVLIPQGRPEHVAFHSQLFRDFDASGRATFHIDPSSWTAHLQCFVGGWKTLRASLDCFSRQNQSVS